MNELSKIAGTLRLYAREDQNWNASMLRSVMERCADKLDDADELRRAPEPAGLERIEGMEFYIHENPDDADAEPVRLVMAMSHNDKVFCHRITDGNNGICKDDATPDSAAAEHAGAFDVRKVRAFLPPRPACYGNTFKGVPLQYSEANAVGFLHDALDEIERLRRLSRREG